MRRHYGSIAHLRWASLPSLWHARTSNTRPTPRHVTPRCDDASVDLTMERMEFLNADPAHFHFSEARTRPQLLCPPRGGVPFCPAAGRGMARGQSGCIGASLLQTDFLAACARGYYSPPPPSRKNGSING
jgi:hypothetical protein